MPFDDLFEQFVWVDESDHELGTITRQEAHNGSRKIHRAVTILIFNQDKTKILFQRRSLSKDLNPGRWSCGVGGHVTYGDTYEQAAKRELQEELGITVDKIHFLMKHLYDLSYEREYMPIYEAAISNDQQVRPDPSEVMGTQWCSVDKVADFVASHPMCPDAVEMLTQTGFLPPAREYSSSKQTKL